jgi:uncharacterized coiled-coil protein SlyX
MLDNDQITEARISALESKVTEVIRSLAGIKEILEQEDSEIKKLKLLEQNDFREINAGLKLIEKAVSELMHKLEGNNDATKPK